MNRVCTFFQIPFGLLGAPLNTLFVEWVNDISDAGR
jgi:hypothetical protein